MIRTNKISQPTNLDDAAAWESYWKAVDEERAEFYARFAGLSLMTRNALLSEGIESKEDAIAYIAENKKIFGVGKVGRQQIKAWLGLPVGEPKGKAPLTAKSIPRAIALLEAHGYTVNPPAPATPPASTPARAARSDPPS